MSDRNAPATLLATEETPFPVFTDITGEARRLPAFDGHEQVFQVDDHTAGLHAIIAIHDTTLGPALGGCRAVAYPSRRAALTDALRLSRGMTLKSAIAGLDLGGGKAVLLLDHGAVPTEAMMRSFGQAVDSLGGRYITGEDSGTSVREMDWIHDETPHVIGTSARGGDPSRMTALGVLAGIRAAIRHRLGRDTLDGIAAAVQGLGHVGAALCALLADAGAQLTVADIVPARVESMVTAFGAEAVAPDDIHRAHADVFAPCGLGAVLNESSIPELGCAVVAGSANNQLASDADGAALHRRGILYAPDYVINAGGLISAEMGRQGHDPNGPESRARVERIGAVLDRIFTRSETSRTDPATIAGQMARERLLAGGAGVRATEGVNA